MVKPHFHKGLIAAFALCISTNALADIVYTTMPGPQSGGSCFGAGNIVGVGIHTPVGSSYQLDSIQVRLHDTATAANTPFSFDVYNDNGGLPGALVASVGAGNGTSDGVNSTFDLYTITPVSPIALNTDTTYWIVASSSSADGCAFGWSHPGVDPAGGVFTYVGEEQYFNGSWNNRDGYYNELEINASISAPKVPSSIPTLSEWGLIALSSLLALGTIFTLRRNRQ